MGWQGFGTPIASSAASPPVSAFTTALTFHSSTTINEEPRDETLVIDRLQPSALSRDDDTDTKDESEFQSQSPQAAPSIDNDKADEDIVMEDLMRSGMLILMSH